MENPATWDPAEKIISRVLADRINILPEFKCGLSLERRIADALRDAGLLREEKEWETSSSDSPPSSSSAS